MLSKLKLPLVALVFSFTGLASADTDRGTDLERLLDVTGITSSIAAIPKSIDDEMSAEALTAQVGDPQLATIINRAASNNLTQSLFDNSIRDSLNERLTKSEISQQLAFYDTPLGQRIADAHRQDQYLISKRVKDGERLALSTEREKLITQLDLVIMGSDNAERIAIDAATVMSHSMMSAMGMPVSLEQVRAMVAPSIMSDLETLTDEYHATMAYTYEALSDDDLRQFISYMAKPESTIFCDALWNGMSRAFLKGGTAMGSELVAELQGAF